MKTGSALAVAFACALIAAHAASWPALAAQAPDSSGRPSGQPSAQSPAGQSPAAHSPSDQAPAVHPNDPLPDAPEPSLDQENRGAAAETAPEPSDTAPAPNAAIPRSPGRTPQAGVQPGVQPQAGNGGPAGIPEGKPEQSSSEQTRGDISPPREDELAHPNSGTAPGTPGVREWNPLRAMKDVEIGTFYYNEGNYKAAISRFREALEFKPRDAAATFKLAQALEKSGALDESRLQYEAYLAILKDGPSAGEARKSLERLRKK